MTTKTLRALSETAGLLRAPQRVIPLAAKVAADKLHSTFAYRHLYSYATSTVPTANALRSVVDWILHAQRPDGGIAAYYSLLTGYSDSYPEVTGYIIPTLYDFGREADDAPARLAAERATAWLLSLQMPSGAFPAGLHRSDSSPDDDAQPSVFNTGQILQGLVRAYSETGSTRILERAVAAGDWLAAIQQPDGSWTGEAAYQGTAHTYYSMVSWSLALLAAESKDPRHATTADKNIDWVLTHVQPSGWIDGVNLRGHPTYLHFIEYVIQGMLECGILRRREDAIEAAAKSAWVLLRKFETHKRLSGTYESDFKSGQSFSCLTGNAQMSCVWLRLYEVTGDLRYLNAALKINEMLMQSLPAKGSRGIVGGVAGSYPIWCAYQPMRFISWGGKFLADALIQEQRLTRSLEARVDASEAHTQANTHESPEANPEPSECA
ncbi:MAG: prenyltransferase/squalene oxidase repeat-containing protein [Terriglobales bacterium]